MREGYIKGYKVFYNNQYDLSDKRSLGEDLYLVKKCLMLLPHDITLEDFLHGMMRVTEGKVNPSIIKEVWNESNKTSR